MTNNAHPIPLPQAGERTRSRSRTIESPLQREWERVGLRGDAMDARRPGSSITWRPQTRMVRGGLTRSEFGETAEALYLTSGYVYVDAEQAEARFQNKDAGYIYSRYGNPTVGMFEERMCLLEGAAASRAVASGMAAVNAALMCQVRAGDRVVASRALFGSCRYIIEELLPRYGVTTTLVDGPDLAQWRAAL